MSAPRRPYSGGYISLMGLIIDFIIAWLLMLSFGVAHGYAGSVPLFGYWACYLFGFTFTAMIGLGVLGVSARLDSAYRTNIATTYYEPR